MNALRRAGPLLLIPALLAVLVLAGCNTVARMTGAQKRADARAEELKNLQLSVMQFADEYTGRIAGSVAAFKSQTMLSEERLVAQEWLLAQANSAYTIASGPNPINNALDMVVLATLSRMVLEDSWVEEKYGERAKPLLETHTTLEPRAWELVNNVLTEEQRTELRRLIDEWRERNPHVRSVAYTHFQDFAKASGRPKAGETKKTGNLFAFLGLDPLSTLDPAVREIEQTRHLAERAIFYLQRYPRLLDMEVERLTYEFASMPLTRELMADIDRVSLASEAAGKLAGELPTVVARERQAAIDQFTQALYAQESHLRELAVELRGTLEAGTATSNSLDTTIRSLDSLMARFDKPSANPAPEPAVPAKPFDIADYAAAAREFSVTARELQALVQSIDAGTPGLDNLTARASVELNTVIDHLFWRLVLLGVILVIACVAGAVAYRLIARRIGSQAAR